MLGSEAYPHSLMRWSSRLLVWGLLIGLLGVLVTPAFAVPDDEDSSLSYFDAADDARLSAIPDSTPGLRPGVESLVGELWRSTAVIVLAPCARSLAVASPVLLRSPPGA
jgi:hypothetical protein